MRFIRYHVTAALAILLQCVSGNGVAQEGGDSMRCGNRLALSGYSVHQVRSLCGEPDAASRHFEQRAISAPGACSIRHDRVVCDPGVNLTVTVEVEDWTYDFGRNQFIRYLRFENGRLVRIDTGGYGLKELP
jgi:hypothetical protein